MYFSTHRVSDLRVPFTFRKLTPDDLDKAAGLSFDIYREVGDEIFSMGDFEWC